MTSSPAYVQSLSTNYQTTNYQTMPLLTVGDEVPYLRGTFGNYTPDPTLKFGVPGIPDGLGVVEYKGDPCTNQDDRYYVFMNSEIGTTVFRQPNTPENYIFTYINSSQEAKIRGARVSLFEFDANWNIIGGRNLIETATDNISRNGRSECEPDDNLTVLTNGRVLIQEDRAYDPSQLGGGDIFTDENRQAYVWEYDPRTNKLIPIAELLESAFPDLGNDPATPGEWESSGIVQVGTSNQILFDVQAHTDLKLNNLYSEGGQLLLAIVNPAIIEG